MADFNTHLLTATLASGLAATVCLKLSVVGAGEAVMLAAAGVLGGVLPDIDLKYSVPTRLLFTAFGVLLALAMLLSNVQQYSVVEVWFFAVAGFGLIRYPVAWLFNRFTVHRGNLHSLLATGLFVLISATLAFRVLGQEAWMSWMLALFVGGGCVVHLLLDEIYSVDFMGIRVRRSFGSALKPFDWSRPWAAGIMGALCLALSWFIPPWQPLMATWRNVEVNWTTAVLPGPIADLLAPVRN